MTAFILVFSLLYQIFADLFEEGNKKTRFWFIVRSVTALVCICFYGGSLYIKNILPNNEEVLVKQENIRIKITEINPPKHFYISFSEVNGTRKWNSLFVSKHCNNYRQNRIGNILTIKFYTYEKAFTKEKVYRFENLYNVFCK